MKQIEWELGPDLARKCEVRLREGTATGPARELDPDELCMDSLLLSLCTHGLDRIDAAIGEYYASRVSDPVELQWRTDYARHQIRGELAMDIDGPNAEDPDAVWLHASAAEIRQPYTSDPEIGPRWAELTEAWITCDHADGFPYDDDAPGIPTMPGEAPPGMDPVTWRSQLQARDLAGHGRWLSTTTTSTTAFERQGTEPMNEITRDQNNTPAHETESETETWTEQEMRADYAHAAACERDPEDYDPADELDYREYSGRWMDDEKWMQEWFYLSEAHDRWRRDPQAATDTSTLSPIRARSEEQAKYMAEHGIERAENGSPTSPYITRVDDVRDARTRSALAEFKPGNAIAARSADTESERDGIEH